MPREESLEKERKATPWTDGGYDAMRWRCRRTSSSSSRPSAGRSKTSTCRRAATAMGSRCGLHTQCQKVYYTLYGVKKCLTEYTLYVYIRYVVTKSVLY